MTCLQKGDLVHIRWNIVTGMPWGIGRVDRVGIGDLEGRYLVVKESTARMWHRGEWLVALKPKPVTHE